MRIAPLCSRCHCTSAWSTSSQRRAVEDRRGHVDLAVLVGVLGLERLGAVVVPALHRGPPEVGLEDLADVHARRHAQRVEDHVDRRAVLQERHVLLGHDLGDHALVAVPARRACRPRRSCASWPRTRAPGRSRPATGRRPRRAQNVLTSITTPPSPCGTFRRRVANLARLLLEDRADQLLLRRQLGLALRRDLADQQIARLHLGADAHDAAVVEVPAATPRCGSGYRA